MQEIDGTHAHAKTGDIYAYTARYDDSKKGLHIQLTIPIVARGKTLVIERTVFFDALTTNAAALVARFANHKIDETDFESVDVG